MAGKEAVTNPLITRFGAARATKARPRFADLVIRGLIVALAIGGFVM